MIRPATPQDAQALDALDRRNFSFRHSPVPPRDRPFDTEGVIVCELDGELAGYTKISRLWPIPSVDHVRRSSSRSAGSSCGVASRITAGSCRSSRPRSAPRSSGRRA